MSGVLGALWSDVATPKYKIHEFSYINEFKGTNESILTAIDEAVEIPGVDHPQVINLSVQWIVDSDHGFDGSDERLQTQREIVV